MKAIANVGKTSHLYSKWVQNYGCDCYLWALALWHYLRNINEGSRKGGAGAGWLLQVLWL